MQKESIIAVKEGTEQKEVKFALITPEGTVLSVHKGFTEARESLKETLSEEEGELNILRLFFPGQENEWDIQAIMTPLEYMVWPHESKLCTGGKPWVLHWEKENPDEDYLTSNLTPVYLVDMMIWH